MANPETEKPDPPPKSEGTASGNASAESSSQQTDLAELVGRIEKQIGPLVQGKAREQVVSRITAIVQEEVFRGPLPHPRHLAEYERIHLGAADRIIAMAEKSLDSNIGLATQAQRDDNEDRRLGMWLGFGALVLLVLCAVVCTLSGYPVMGGAFIGVGVVGVVARFITGRGNG